MDTKEIEAIIQFLKSCVEQSGYVYSANDLKGVAPYENIKKKTPTYIKEYIQKIVDVISTMEDGKYGTIQNQMNSFAFYVITGLIRKNLSYTEEEWIRLFEGFKKVVEKRYTDFNKLPISYAVQQIERFVKKNQMTPTLESYITELLTPKDFKSDSFMEGYGSEEKKDIKRLKDLLGLEEAFQLDKNKYYGDDKDRAKDDLSTHINEAIKASDIGDSKDFNEILSLAHGASQGQPTAKFSKLTTAHIDSIGKDKYRKTAHEILRIVAERPLGLKEEKNKYNYSYHSHDYIENAATFIKGIVWTMEIFSDKTTIDYLVAIFEKSYTKLPGHGPIAAAVGNACAYTLGNMRGKDGLGTLARLKLKVKQNNIKKIIDKYLAAGAEKYGVSVEELKEMAVPDYKLVDGKKSVAFGEYGLDLSIEGNKVVQQWVKPDGSGMKSVPAAVKNDEKLAQKLKDVRKEVKEIQKVYSAQKQRIDNQFILARAWHYASFEKFYLRHGLVSPIANRLIFTLTLDDKKTAAMHLHGAWEDVEGTPIDWVNENTTVSLWHPVFSNEKEITQWRDRIMELECKQPFKQAFRELYILTDAEINTVSYSNRMAAHILKQHIFKQLAILRDWKYSAIMCYDGGSEAEIAQKELPEFGITAEYFIDPLTDEDSYSDTGSWLYVISDQVRFKNKEGAVMNLIDVPPVVLSEILRDVDLFVGVCSVGNDPAWQDNSGERQQTYWRAYSFGDLTEVAKTRKAILERLLPRLNKLKGKAKLDGKFLIIEGTVRTYKIHIGSGNILMKPNDQYLCIVPDRNPEKKTDKIFIPFEGDKGLSIVLSKAFLLAEDNKITDTTILSQINRKD